MKAVNILVMIDFCVSVILIVESVFRKTCSYCGASGIIITVNLHIQTVSSCGSVCLGMFTSSVGSQNSNFDQTLFSLLT